MNVRRPRSRSYAVLDRADDLPIGELCNSDLFVGPVDLDCLPRSSVRSQWYRRRAVVFDQGDDAGTMFVVGSGSVLISRTSIEGRELSVDFVARRQTFGEEAFFCDATYMTTATCTTDACIFAIDGGTLRQAAERSPALAANVARVGQRRFETVSSLLETIAFNTVADRIMRIFDKFGVRNEDSNEAVSLDLTHGDIATMVGSTRESVSAAIGMLTRHGRLKIQARRLTVVPSPRDRAAAAS